MQNFIKKELYWLIGTVTLILFVIVGVFGINGFKPDSTTDINVHDTYYVISTTHAIVLITPLIFFSIYLIRIFYQKFKNPVSNTVFMFSDIILIFIFTFLISFAGSIRETPGTTIYPPLSGIDNKVHDGNIWNDVYYILLIFQLFFIILLAISAVLTGYNYRLIKKEPKN